MRKSVVIGFVFGVALTVSPTLAHAQSDGTGIELGLRLGYGIPLGAVSGADSDTLNDGVSGQIPLWLDLGFRVVPELFVGLYGQYGIGFMTNEFDPACDLDGVGCSVSDVRVGVQAHYMPSPEAEISPWFGVGFGYEWLSLSVEGLGVEVSTTLRGLELLHLQGGVDFQVTDHVRIGPLVSFSLGQFSAASAECSGTAGCGMLDSIDGDIEDTALHEWLVIGVRAVYGP